MNNKLPLRIFAFILFIFISHHSAHGQRTTKDGKLIRYKVWIKGTVDAQGLLYNATDSSLFITQDIYDSNPVEYRISDIKTLKIRRENSIKKGALWGLSIGAVSGIIIGANNVPSEGSKIGTLLAYTGIFGTIGALAGILITAPKKVFISHSNTDIYLRTYQKKLIPNSLKTQGI